MSGVAASPHTLTASTTARSAGPSRSRRFEHQLRDVCEDGPADPRPEDPCPAAAEQPSGIGERRDERSDEQRNALRPGTEQVEQRRRWRASEKASGQRGDTAGIQRMRTC